MKKSKKLLRQAQPKLKKREPRKVIISFRLRNTEVASLKADMRTHPSFSVVSLKQFCRKLVVDYIANLLIYATPKDRQSGGYRMVGNKIMPVDPATAKAEITCDMADGDFLKALHRFLDDSEDNWKKLRAFMLGLGYPERQAKEFRDTLDDYERLQIAKQVLAKMIKTL